MPVSDYPEWQYYPPHSTAPEWATDLVGVVAAARDAIDTNVPDRAEKLTSDTVLQRLSGALRALGYETEAGKLRSQKVRRPVLFGRHGRERVAYEVDAVHDELESF